MAGTGRLPLLTSLRFFAAFEVLVFHCGGDLLVRTATPIQNLFKNGYEAVTFFFLLSGFVLTYSHRRPQEFASRESLWSYYIARIVRIYPVYVLGLVISAPMFYYAGCASRIVDSDVFFSGLVLVPTLLQAWYPPAALAWNSPAWSLSVEAAFYAALPLVIRRFSSISIPIQVGLSLGLLCSTEVLRNWLAVELRQVIGLGSVAETNFSAYFPLFFAPVFMFGSSLARIYADCPGIGRVANVMFNSAAAAVLALFCLRSNLPSWVFSNIVLTPLFGAVILGATSATGWPARLLAAKYLILLGDSSYALYILHAPLSLWLKQIVNSGPQGSGRSCAVTVLFLLGAIALSTICYLYIEVPIQRRLRRVPGG
jgi:peptidoglycan/LPS O-acetylase OafA/YrhL